MIPSGFQNSQSPTVPIPQAIQAILDKIGNLIPKPIQQIADIGNTQAPIIGGIRQFNDQNFGLPDYANPNVSGQKKLKDLLSRSIFAVDMQLAPDIHGSFSGYGGSPVFGNQSDPLTAQWDQAQAAHDVPKILDIAKQIVSTNHPLKGAAQMVLTLLGGAK